MTPSSRNPHGDYGSTPTYTGIPTRPDEAQYSYAFAGWSPEIVPVKGDATYTARYVSSAQQYTITFKNWDGVELQKSLYEYGRTPSYRGTGPSRADDTIYTYTFAGWDPAIVQVSQDATYTAQYTKKVIYKIGPCYLLNSDGQSYAVSGYNGYPTEVIIPSEFDSLPVTAISPYAFFQSYLTSITIPDSVVTIGAFAFCHCRKLSSVTLGKGLKIIDSDAFEDDDALKSITLPPSLQSIGVSAFSNSQGLTSITIPDSVTTIHENAFDNCTGLTSLTLGSSLHLIDYFAFLRCTGLTSLKIPASVTTIRTNAFQECSGLLSVLIPSSVAGLSWNVFLSCTNANIYCEATALPSSWDSGWNTDGGTAYWYSETKKTGCWHYVNNVPTLW
jgi:hypothetical protein